MNNKSWKFIFLGVMIMAVVLFLALTTFEESKSYFLNVDEVKNLGSKAIGMPLKMRGIVQNGSLRRKEDKLEFVLSFNGKWINIRYVGRAVVPDTFKPNIEAIVAGTMKDANHFEATQIQAKCASKYEADYSKFKENTKNSI